MELTDKQWSRLEPVILQSVPKKDSRSRKPRDPREVLNGILWVLRPGKTCRRRFQHWVKAGVFRRVVEGLAADLQERGRLDLREAFTDGGFVPAEKWAPPSAGQNAAEAAGSWLLRMLPVFLSPPVLQALRRMR